ncbi:MAG: hypothetical protein JNJ47_05155, partial [Alphaproteobacteria bacterium]|nr:hypothetical protein [Alphaproteobacteria bacterium]
MNFTIAIDAMGGDKAPEVIIQGLKIVAQRYPIVNFLLYGEENKVRPYLSLPSSLEERITFIPCQEVITAETKPSAAIRGLPNSSMRQAILAVVEGRAQGVVSAGNTGAYMALAKILLKTMPGIDRPAPGDCSRLRPHPGKIPRRRSTVRPSRVRAQKTRPRGVGAV